MYYNKTGRKYGDKLARLRAQFPAGSRFGVDDVVSSGLAPSRMNARALVALLIRKGEVKTERPGWSRNTRRIPAIFCRVKEAL